MAMWIIVNMKLLSKVAGFFMSIAAVVLLLRISISSVVLVLLIALNPWTEAKTEMATMTSNIMSDFGSSIATLIPEKSTNVVVDTEEWDQESTENADSESMTVESMPSVNSTDSQQPDNPL